MDNVLGLAFVSLAALFSVWNASSLWRYLKYRRLTGSEELCWTPKRPWFYGMSLGIGFFMVSLTVLSVFVLKRPALATASQALMAFYYTVSFPLSMRIKRGFYKSGIWMERAFVPYRRMQRLSWRESPRIVLVVDSDAGLLGEGYTRLVVPGERYGEARRILAGHIEDQTLTVDKDILGLSDVDSPAQERV